ncbi:MAG TPA: Na-translocating system protein MpsC family protein [Thermoleophilaceae bacterium]
MASERPARPTGGELSVAISNGMVQILRRTTGRGPTKARTTIGRDHVLVMIADTLTTGERTLVKAGYGEDVLLTRRRFQEVMRPEATSMIEQLTGRTVIGFMSDNHANPDLGVEVFILEPDGRPAELAEGESSEGM